MKKNFKLEGSEIVPLALGYGGCLATDRIVVGGSPVGYMYREKPIDERDSGWRFFAGDEDDAYMKNNDNHGVYDVNTIANYDREILQFLDSDFGSRFERNAHGKLEKL